MVLWFDTVVSLVPSQIPTTVMTDTYLGLVLTAGATLSFVHVTIPAYVVPAANPVMTGLYLITFLFTGWGIHWIITQSGQQVEYHDFKAGDRPATSRLGKITSIILVSVASYGLAALLVIYMSTYSDALTAPTTDPLLTIVVLGAAIPALYIGSGLIYQTLTYGYRTLTLFTASRPVDPALPLEIEATIRAVDTDTYYAASLDTGFNQYIFVSEPVWNDLDSEQRTAIIAHEAGHLKNGDAFLSFIVPIAALFLLCGKNVLYSIIDFRSREYRADSYATQHVDPTTFTETLTLLSAETMPQWTGATPAFSPFTGYQPQDILGSVYGLFFGSFTLAEAHPSVEDRINRCQSIE